MGKYAERDWYIKHSRILIEKYGDVPPPWVYEPRAHPSSICWRMGGGESHVMILGEWLNQQAKSEKERVEYLKKYPPPPAWMKWTARFIYDLGDDSWKKHFDFTPYFEQLKVSGFERVDDFEADYNSDKWI